ncbi:hypothetical protein M673_24082 (plasmid) [Aureimonas sp. AU20]|nr:hypothetical protein M673_24082 [Aureimonas sp. AU20]
MRSFQSRLGRLEAAVTPRVLNWRPAIRVMVNETTTNAEVGALLEREGMDLPRDGPWIVVRRLISPSGHDVLPDGPYVAQAGGRA